MLTHNAAFVNLTRVRENPYTKTLFRSVAAPALCCCLLFADPPILKACCMSNLSPEPCDPPRGLPSAAALRDAAADFDLETITAAVDSGQPLAQILDLVVERACLLLEADETFVLLREDDWLVCAAQRGLAEVDGTDIRVRVDESIEGWVATRRRPLVIIDPYRDPRFRALPHRRQ